jgi:adenylate cyclase
VNKAVFRWLNALPAAWRWRWLVTVGIIGLLGSLSDMLLLQRLEWLAEDLRLKARANLRPAPASEQVILVGVDELSLKTNGRWPFARSLNGKMIELLGADEAARPAVMAWDYVFSEPNHDPRDDAAFVQAMGRAPYPLITGAFTDPAATGFWSGGEPATTLGLTSVIACPPEVRDQLPDHRGAVLPIKGVLTATRFAFLNADADEDGVVRRLPLVIRVGERVFPGLVLQTLMTLWDVAPDGVEIKPGAFVRLRSAAVGERVIPIDEEGRYVINFRHDLAGVGKGPGIPILSYTGDDTHPGVMERLVPRMEFGMTEISAPETGGRVVVVGEVASGLTDIGPSPLRSETPKVLFHLNSLENILTEDHLRHAPVWPLLAGLLLAGLGAAWALERYSFNRYVMLVVFLSVAPAVAGLAMLLNANLMVPLALPLAGFAAQQAIFATMKIREEQAKRDRIRRMFGSYVSPELVRRLVEARAEPQLGGHEEEITAFFSDIQGFSSFSEVLSPADLVVLLNEYLGAMTDILQNEGGALDKYIGDAIVAMFGGLVPLPNHAARACEAVARMQQRQAELREYWRSQGDRWPPLVHAMRTRIGLNSGRVVVGNMGSSHRFNYTMMGDVVNLAARCESGAKAFGVYSLATENTVRAAQASGCGCVFRSLDRIVVKGRSEPVEIFEIVGLAAEVSEGTRACLEMFAEGRAAYLRQDWTAAKAAFTASAELEPLRPGRDGGVENNPSTVMLERCAQLMAEPPPANWDGVYRMKSK